MTVIIDATAPFKYKIEQLKTKVVIDIFNTRSLLPLIKRSSSTSFSRIRTSEHATKPIKTRVVIDLLKNTTFKTHKLTGSQLTLTFSPPPKKKRKQKKAKVPSSSKPLINKVIAIDPGHGGRDPGGIGINRTYEKTYTLDIAKRLEKKLKNKGAFVIMSRTKDTNTSLKRRTYQANKSQADILISVHLNSFSTSKPNGTETYYYKPKDKKLASLIQKEMVNSLNLKNNGTKRNRLYVLKHSKMPAALVEPGFITNRRDYSKLRTDAFREQVADAITTGILKYFKYY